MVNRTYESETEQETAQDTSDIRFPPRRKPLSRLYLSAQRIVLFLIVFFIIFYVVFGWSDMRAENFRYLIRYLDRSSLTTGGNYKTVYYSGTSPQFSLYKGDLAVLSDGTLTLYNMSGGVVMTSSVPNDAILPGHSASDRYITVYSRSKGAVMLYNSFSLVSDESYKKIYSATGFGDGSYAVISSGNEYRTMLTMYDRNFRSVYSFKTDSLITSVFCEDDNLYFTSSGPEIAGVLADGGMKISELVAMDVSTAEELFRMSLEGVALGIYSDGSRIYVATTRGIYIFTKKGDVIQQYNIPISQFFYSEEQKCCCFASPVGNNTAVIFASRGEMSAFVCGNVDDVAFFDGGIFVLSTKTALKITPSDGVTQVNGIGFRSAESRSIVLPSGMLRIFPLSKNSILVCGKGSASKADF